MPIIAATRGADSFSESVAAGSRVELAAISSIAKSLGARKICSRALECSTPDEIRSVVVSVGAGVRVCISFMDDHRIVVGLACGAALAAVYDDLLVIVSGRDGGAVQVPGSKLVNGSVPAMRWAPGLNLNGTSYHVS